MLLAGRDGVDLLIVVRSAAGGGAPRKTDLSAAGSAHYHKGTTVKIRVERVNATEKYLNVAMIVEQGGGIRFAMAQVPLEMLLSEEVTDRLDALVRRQLRQRWLADSVDQMGLF